MGMGLFYVTVLVFFFCGADGARIGVFTGFLRGLREKLRFHVVFLWCSYGGLRGDCGEAAPCCLEVKNFPRI
jgi:hypothetical protein